MAAKKVSDETRRDLGMAVLKTLATLNEPRASDFTNACLTGSIRTVGEAMAASVMGFQPATHLALSSVFGETGRNVRIFG